MPEVYRNVVPLGEAQKQELFPKLETFACPYKAAALKTGILRIIFPEFTCVCPRTGYPDFARISLYYQPGTRCLELKSWKLYLNAFRMVGAFHETVTAHLFTTLKAVLGPRWMLLAAEFSPRGNVATAILFETPGKRPVGAELLIDPSLSGRRNTPTARVRLNSGKKHG